MNDLPRLRVESGTVVLSGPWTLAEMLPLLASLRESLARVPKEVRHWDLSAVSRLDSAAAVLLWRAWQGAWPGSLDIGDMHRQVIARVAELPPEMPPPPTAFVHLPEFVGRLLFKAAANLYGMIVLFGQLLLDCLYLARHPADIPWREFTANVYKAGALALPVTALVGFLIGVTISYLSALQLKSFGADLFIVNILGISIIRELGPVLAAILIAGRSGSAITAQIGVMRVTEELDAMRVMGIPQGFRLVMPRALALALVMPLISVWTTIAALLGGMLAAYVSMDVTFSYFINALPAAVKVSNLVLATAKSVVFGLLIALVGCHYGLRVKPNTESLGQGTTASVVTSITVVILVDALFAVLFKSIGI